LGLDGEEIAWLRAGVAGLAGIAWHPVPGISHIVERGLNWLLSAQNADGGWSGGAHLLPSSIEETALALDALAAAWDSLSGRCRGASVQVSNRHRSSISVEGLESAISKGTSRLIEHTRDPNQITPSPIGLYFAKLWYFEKLYPLIFTVGALERVQKQQAE